jgi:hypothetical protein
MAWPDLRTILATWLAIPLTALDWWLAWDRLPARVAMKYAANGRAVAWASREDAMTFDLVLLAVVLGVATLAGVAGLAVQPERGRRISTGILVCATLVFLVVNGVLWLYQVA